LLGLTDSIREEYFQILPLFKAREWGLNILTRVAEISRKFFNLSKTDHSPKCTYEHLHLMHFSVQSLHHREIKLKHRGDKFEAPPPRKKQTPQPLTQLYINKSPQTVDKAYCIALTF